MTPEPEAKTDNRELEDWADIAKLSRQSWTVDNPWESPVTEQEKQ